MKLYRIPTFPKRRHLTFGPIRWSKFAGRAGAWLAVSGCGHFELIAEPLGVGWQFWLVRSADGVTVDEICAP